jgi:alpha-glucosidase
MKPADDWWRTAVVYQIYPRSFADSDGDGVGDLPGITAGLQALSELGVDAVWLSPFYTSPQVDGGYDVADHCAVDPLFGTLADFDALLARAHELGLRVLVDLVPNHTSSAHRWFREALAAGPGTAPRDRYVFRDEPNDWRSVFGGSAWTQVPDGQWYLHLFDAGQPDLNWAEPEVWRLFEEVLRFWLDRGVDGFRVDVAHGLVKDPSFPDFADVPAIVRSGPAGPYWDQEGVHEIYRRWRVLLGEYTQRDPGRTRILCAETHLPVERATRYVRPDEMHQAFNFAYVKTPFEPKALRVSIDDTSAAYADVGAPTTWVLSNHDTVRHATRYGYPSEWPPDAGGIGATDPQPDPVLGLRRARAATLLMLALPGVAYLYQGEELGLPEHTTLPDDLRQDPTWQRSRHTSRGRDGCRVPLPWVAAAPAYGFSPTGRTWLPQPDSYRGAARDRQAGDPESTLAMYRTALALRRTHRLGAGRLRWISAASDPVLRFTTSDVTVLCNLGPTALPLPESSAVLLASGPVDGGVPPETTVWLTPVGAST